MKTRCKISSFVLAIFVLVFTYSCSSTSTKLLPTVTTIEVTAATSSTAVSGGTITSDGGATITAQGVCWGTTSNPTTSNSKVANTSGTTSFSSSLTGLTANTTYYARAYATNSEGTSYGNEVTFTTLAPTLPVLTTTAIAAIGATTATTGGTVTTDGGSAITARGVCWSTTSGPTIGLTTKTSDATGSGTFTSSITGLTALTTYYVRAYATNSVGTTYSNELSFTTTAVSVNTSGSLAVTFSTTTYSGQYAPRHVLAVWVTNSSGIFVKSLLVYANAQKKWLTNWYSATSAGNTTDATTGATQSSHATRTCSWNGTNVSKTVVENGSYNLCVEYTESNGTGKLATFPFTKGTSTDVQSATTKSGVSLSTLTWTPN